MKSDDIWHEYYALTTTKEAYKLSFNSQNIECIEKSIKYTHWLMDLKMKSKFELLGIKKERIFNCIHLICLSELCHSIHLSVRASRISIG